MLLELCGTRTQDDKEEPGVGATQYLVNTAYQTNMQHVLFGKPPSIAMVEPRARSEAILLEDGIMRSLKEAEKVDVSAERWMQEQPGPSECGR